MQGSKYILTPASEKNKVKNAIIKGTRIVL